MNKLWANIKCTLKHSEKYTDNRNISKHSWRVLYATTLYNKGLESNAISGRSGHCSDGAAVYKRHSVEVLNKGYMALQPPSLDDNKENVNIFSI